MSGTTPPRIVDPPFYDPPIADYPSGQQHSQAWTEYHQSVADQVNALTVTRNQGVVDGSDAAAGQVGEYLTASSSGVALASNTQANVATLNLTPGDWDVSGLVSFSASSGSSHTSFGAGLDTIGIYNQGTFPTGPLTQGIGLPPKRYSVSAATAVQLVAIATFGSGTVSAQGAVRARRMR
jgi:hypothetical protein